MYVIVIKPKGEDFPSEWDFRVLVQKESAQGGGCAGQLIHSSFPLADRKQAFATIFQTSAKKTIPLDEHVRFIFLRYEMPRGGLNATSPLGDS